MKGIWIQIKNIAVCKGFTYRMSAVGLSYKRRKRRQYKIHREDFRSIERQHANSKCWSRAKNVCEWCNKNSGFVVHHIKKWKDNTHLRYKLSNLILLCRDCDINCRGKEQQYE